MNSAEKGKRRGLPAALRDFVITIVRNPNLIVELTKKEIRAKYLGSYLGILWAFFLPVATISIFWFLFAIGFRTGPAETDYPYILWLLAGMVPWFFLNDGVVNGAGAILDNSFLIKKVSFRIGVLPLVRVLASLANNLVLIALMFGIFALHGRPLTVYSLQLIYYLGAAVILVTGISFILATVAVFVKDTRHVATIFMQFGFWLTAVFWSISIVPPKFRFLIRLNPFSYIVEGFRDSLIMKTWFWKGHALQTAYFWCLTLGVFLAGILIFRKLRPYFADHV